MPNTAVATSADVAFVTPAVLKWAIKNSRLATSQVVEKLGVTVDQLNQWEGGIPIPFRKAQALAKLLRIPFGYFFLDEPPAVSLPLPDFRAHGGSPSPEFIQFLNEVLVKQDWFRDHLREQGTPRLKFVGSFTTASPETDVADNIRSTIGLTAELRASVSSWGEYLSTLARNAEGAGILVMRSSVVGNITNRRLLLDEVQGFAISDPYAPVVFVNSADFQRAQIFTLAHELVHIWIDQSAIGNADPVAIGGQRVEGFCNRVAAALLVPANEFRTSWKTMSEEKRVTGLARRFWVSTLVILRRAHELDLISQEEFYALREEEIRKLSKTPKASGGDFYRNVFVRMSARLTYAVLSEVNRGNMLLRDGAQLLSLRVQTLAKFAEAFR
jgi:Zn-dependent peptidase ImmA (M78 family)